MGDGLADGQQVGDATGSEWRTPPLWGIGLTKRVSGHTFFLHDGRARNLTEAILWHGGEAQKAARRLCRARGGRPGGADQISGVAVMPRFERPRSSDLASLGHLLHEGEKAEPGFSLTADHQSWRLAEAKTRGSASPLGEKVAERSEVG